ncbi:MAG TPA: DUF2167 domain-containing protein [Candidatus Binatia bacterium]|jgi:uncharacterized membrane-anchored protein|nr:DUF2167 domain-containing protein [Candidatus Binatia bacterium]
MSHCKFILVFAAALALSSPLGFGQTTDKKPKLNVLRGPAKAPLGNVAQLDLPTGYAFLDGKDYRALRKAQGEPVSGEEMGFLRPTNEDWAVVFRFSDIGYVKDDDKDQLDADKLLAAIKRGTAAGNKVRAQSGIPPIEVVGWDMPPKYDATTHNLEWAIRGVSEDHAILNYNTRMLGRKGVMEVVLIVDPDKLTSTLPTFRTLMAGYVFQNGQTYAEYRQGDKLAKIGLGALVVGGAAVGAAKLGLFAWLAVFLKKGWKLVVVAFAAVATFFKKLFARIFGSKKSESGMSS